MLITAGEDKTVSSSSNSASKKGEYQGLKGSLSFYQLLIWFMLTNKLKRNILRRCVSRKRSFHTPHQSLAIHFLNVWTHLEVSNILLSLLSMRWCDDEFDKGRRAYVHGQKLAQIFNVHNLHKLTNSLLT
jgi:hypothetical protein